MTWHIESDVISIVILALISLDLRNKKVKTDRVDRLFRFITMLSLVVSIIDIVASLIMDYPINRLLYHILLSVYYAVIPVISVAWYIYVCAVIDPILTKRKKSRLELFCLPYVIYVVIALTSSISGLIYTLDENMVYSRGPLMPLSVVIFVIYSLAVFIKVLCNIKKVRQKSEAFVLLFLPVLVAIGTWVQLSVPGLLTTIPAFTVALIAVYIYIQNRRVLTDGLTGVLSRQTGEQKIKESLESEKKTKSAFIITDIDNFKRVNDKASHIFGDEVLRGYATAMCRNLPASYVISRFGGDEFVIYAPDYGTKETLLRNLRAVQAELRKNFPLEPEIGELNYATASIGIAFYPENADDYMELYEHADIALYRAKSSHNGKIRFYDTQDIIEREEAHA